jgi:hypothetical protein
MSETDPQHDDASELDTATKKKPRPTPIAKTTNTTTASRNPTNQQTTRSPRG